ncbi:cation:proton antiporter [Oscillatoriales cyanobacterium LEGE 11467]|uniref:Cation:proton antiporter n=1 Tax=Zarconia navalis LEGE 11467 TaxID=1828826 RepID=A0A928Z9J2_9CYAN|nr:cation:proton antiporter [Zarconia navalis]MBE9041738.1 cation:proton antiporter [Zarconia navalis LEGE 11467]
MLAVLQSIPNSPLVGFTVLLLVILIVPPIFERLRLPRLVGLLVTGILLGSNGLGILDAKSETMKLLSDVGKIYLMFVAGLEIDLAEFRKTKDRSLGFGIATFLIPLIVGSAIGLVFGFSPNASILIGSLMASHTLLGYPIVNRLGVVGNQAITVTVGATIFTDIAALLVLAICVSIHAGEFSATNLILQLVALGVYSALILFGFDWAGKEFFRRTGDEEGNQFLFVLLAVFLAAVGAQAINVDKIVGAFLAGLAVNDVVGRGPVEEKVEFVGSTLFIPFFFVGMGLLLDIPAFLISLREDLGLILAIVGGLLGAKFLAAGIAKLLYGYNWDETLTMWSLSLPQVAATLAAALVGLNAGLIPESVFNTTIVLMLVTSIAGPVMTARFASRLPLARPPADTDTVERPESSIDALFNSPVVGTYPFKVVVPIYNPITERYLVEMAALLARHESGTIVPLSIATAHIHMDEPDLEVSLQRSERLLKRAVQVSEEFGVEAEPKIRIDNDIAHGISRTARENHASLIVMGWSKAKGLRARLFGNLIDSVFWSSHCPVAVVRLLDDPVDIHQILVPVKHLLPKAVQTVRFAQLFADANQARVTLLHVYDRHTPAEQLSAFETELSQILAEPGWSVESNIVMVPGEDVAHIMLKAARSMDMVVLRSRRRRTAGGLAVSDVTTQVMKKLNCSMVLLGEPHS